MRESEWKLSVCVHSQMERVYTVYHSSRGMWKQKVVTTVWAETGFETGSETVQKRTIHPFFRRFPATGLNRFRGWSCPIKFIEEKETKKLKIFLPSRFEILGIQIVVHYQTLFFLQCSRHTYPFLLLLRCSPWLMIRSETTRHDSMIAQAQHGASKRFHWKEETISEFNSGAYCGWFIQYLHSLYLKSYWCLIDVW